jgi:DNA-directed RNA polymerase subunit M/transcription elongation factor TFIIS
MQCKNCSNDMYLAFTDEWVCRDCGSKYDIKGKFISRDIQKKHR